jgi:hypothetical protein
MLPRTSASRPGRWRRCAYADKGRGLFGSARASSDMTCTIWTSGSSRSDARASRRDAYEAAPTEEEGWPGHRSPTSQRRLARRVDGIGAPWYVGEMHSQPRCPTAHPAPEMVRPRRIPPRRGDGVSHAARWLQRRPGARQRRDTERGVGVICSEHEAAPHACQRRGPDHHTGGDDGQSGG